MKTILFVVMMVFTLASCGHREVRVVESEKLVLLEPDAVYLNDCDYKSPPLPADYLSMGKDEREDAIIRTLSKQYSYTGECTIAKRSLRDLIAKQKIVIQQHNAKEDERVQALKKQLETEQ